MLIIFGEPQAPAYRASNCGCDSFANQPCGGLPARLFLDVGNSPSPLISKSNNKKAHNSNQ